MTRGAPYPRLVGDVGGTHASFGWLDSATAGIADVRSLPCAEHVGLEAAIASYLAGRGGTPPRSCALGIATPVTGDTLTMTNLAWTFSIAALRQRIGCERLLVLNDFAALAHALPGLRPGDARQVGGGTALAGAPVALLGPGTGLGVSGLVGAAGPVVVVGEGGHVTLAAADAREAEVIAILRRRFGHVSAERVLSGPGLVNVYEAICRRDGQAAEPHDAAAISARASSGGDARCVEAVDLFFAFLGGVAGDLALTLGARGGLHIAGGIVPKLGDAIDRSRFRERFAAKGRYASYLSAIATFVLADPAGLALRGADAALDA